MSEAVKKNGTTFGILLAAILVLLTVGMYVIDLNLFVNSWIGFIRGLAIIILGVVAVLKAKSLMQHISFKEAFTAFFIVITIGITCYTLTIILIFNLIDPAAKETVSQMFLEATVKALQAFNANSDMIDETIRQQKESNPLGAGAQLMGLAISIIGYSIVGLIVALIFKSRAPQHN